MPDIKDLRWKIDDGLMGRDNYDESEVQEILAALDKALDERDQLRADNEEMANRIKTWATVNESGLRLNEAQNELINDLRAKNRRLSVVAAAASALMNESVQLTVDSIFTEDWPVNTHAYTTLYTLLMMLPVEDLADPAEYAETEPEPDAGEDTPD